MSAKESAIALKQKGNTAFASHDWLKAVDFYTQAIDVNDQDPSFYCNRAQVRVEFSFKYGKLMTVVVGQYQARIVWVCHRGCVQSN